MLEKAWLGNIIHSLERLSLIINGDVQTTPIPFLNIDLCLNEIAGVNGQMKYIVRRFQFIMIFSLFFGLVDISTDIRRTCRISK